MFKLKTIIERLQDERRENEALRALVIGQRTLIAELQDAAVELAGIVSDGGDDNG